MYELTTNDFNLFLSLLKIYDQHQLKRLVTQVMRSHYADNNIRETQHYTYIEGSIPIMLVAHCDTVCTAPVKEIGVLNSGDKTYIGITNKEQAPLGADDRAGIFIILKIIANGYHPHILLTTDEEIGGLGAIAAADEIIAPDVKFILELDRMGSNDAAMYDCDNKKFKKLLVDYGFTPVNGTFSDICFFAPDWDIAAANLSVGYYHEHTPWEVVYPVDLENTLYRVQSILDNADKFKYYDFEPTKTPFNPYAKLINSINLGPLDDGETLTITKNKRKGKKKKKKNEYNF